MALKSSTALKFGMGSPCIVPKRQYSMRYQLRSLRKGSVCIRRPTRQWLDPRYASTSTNPTVPPQHPATRFKNVLLGTTISVFVIFGYLYVTDTRAGMFQSVSCMYDNGCKLTGRHRGSPMDRRPIVEMDIQGCRGRTRSRNQSTESSVSVWTASSRER